jgi:hypothetical protein
MLPWVDDVVRLSASTFEQVSQQIPRLHTEIIGIIKNHDLDAENNDANENPEPNDQMQITPPPQDSELVDADVATAPIEVWLPTEKPVSPFVPSSFLILIFTKCDPCLKLTIQCFTKEGGKKWGACRRCKDQKKGCQWGTAKGVAKPPPAAPEGSNPVATEPSIVVTRGRAAKAPDVPGKGKKRKTDDSPDQFLRPSKSSPSLRQPPKVIIPQRRIPPRPTNPLPSSKPSASSSGTAPSGSNFRLNPSSFLSSARPTPSPSEVSTSHFSLELELAIANSRLDAATDALVRERHNHQAEIRSLTDQFESERQSYQNFIARLQAMLPK